MTDLEHHPKLLAIQQAVRSKGWRFQFILRLTPLNATSVNYTLDPLDLATQKSRHTSLRAQLGFPSHRIIEILQSSSGNRLVFQSEKRRRRFRSLVWHMPLFQTRFLDLH